MVNISELEPRWDQLRLLIGEFNRDLADHPVRMRIDDGPDGRTLWIPRGESAVGISLDGSEYSYRPPVRRSMEEVLDFLRESYWAVSYTHLDVYKRQGRGYTEWRYLQHCLLS